MTTRRSVLWIGAIGALGYASGLDLRCENEKEQEVEGERKVEVLILGGGPAGMSAALYLGRSRRRAVVLDAGKPRHAVAKGIHNFLTREGTTPSEFRRIAWEQMQAYPSVRRAEATVRAAEPSPHGWKVRTEEGEVWESRALLLATGVIDRHPAISGYAERWGESIHHCPYCHGWEMQDRPLAVLASGPAVLHLAPLLRGWTADVILLTHGEAVSPEEEAALRSFSIPIYTSRVVSLEGEGRSLERIVLEDGTKLVRRGLFVAGKPILPSWVTAIGMDVEDGGSRIRVDMMQKTNLSMLWAAGDCASRMQQVVAAASQGGLAGAAIHAALTLGHT